MLFIKQYWKLILIAVLLLGSNYLTKEYVSRGYENVIAEMNVSGLKQTLELQQQEMSKQKLLIQEKHKNEQYYVKENEKLNDAFSNLSDQYSLLINELDSLSESGEGGGAGVDRTRASEATTRIMQAELLRWSLQANAILSEEADKLRLSNQVCVREYNSVREVINK